MNGSSRPGIVYSSRRGRDGRTPCPPAGIEFHHQVEVLALAHRRDTVQVLDVDDPQSPQLHVVAADLGPVRSVSVPTRRMVAVSSETRRVPSGSARGRLAIADPALAEDQHATPVDVDERPVQGDRRRPASLEDSAREIDGALVVRRRQQRNRESIRASSRSGWGAPMRASDQARIGAAPSWSSSSLLCSSGSAEVRYLALPRTCTAPARSVSGVRRAPAPVSPDGRGEVRFRPPRPPTRRRSAPPAPPRGDHPPVMWDGALRAGSTSTSACPRGCSGSAPTMLQTRPFYDLEQGRQESRGRSASRRAAIGRFPSLTPAAPNGMFRCVNGSPVPPDAETSMATKKVVHIIGTGTIGEPLIGRSPTGRTCSGSTR